MPGWAVAYNDVITVPPRHHKHQLSYDPSASYSPSTPDRYNLVLILNAPEHPLVSITTALRDCGVSPFQIRGFAEDCTHGTAA